MYRLPNCSTYLSFVGAASQNPKDEGRGPGEILGLKRPYDAMEGGISRGLPTRDSLSAANCEGKRSIPPKASLKSAECNHASPVFIHIQVL